MALAQHNRMWFNNIFQPGLTSISVIIAFNITIPNTERKRLNLCKFPSFFIHSGIYTHVVHITHYPFNSVNLCVCVCVNDYVRRPKRREQRRYITKLVILSPNFKIKRSKEKSEREKCFMCRCTFER